MGRRSLTAVAMFALVSACTGGHPSAPPTPTTSSTTTSSTTTSSTTTTPATTTTLAVVTTVPPAPLRVAVIGDFGTGGDAQHRVAAAVEAARPDVLVTTGDNFYSDAIDRIWTDPYGWTSARGIPVYAAWGNHDVETTKRVALVQEHLAPPGRWYRVELNGATLVVLDSNQVESEEQLAWLETTLAETAGPTIVVFHVPAHSCGVYGPNASILDRWVPVFERHGVDLVLNGHEHDYERFRVGSVNYVVTGGGGQGIRPIPGCREGTPAAVVVNDTDHHFVLLQIRRGVVQVSAIAADGEVMDEVLVFDR